MLLYNKVQKMRAAEKGGIHMTEETMGLTDQRRELERLREELAGLRRDQALLETLRQQEWQCSRRQSGFAAPGTRSNPTWTGWSG